MLACSHFVEVGSSDAKEVHVHGMVKMRQSTKQNKTKHWVFAKRKKEKCRKTFHLKFLSSAFVDDSVALSRDVVEVIS